MCYLPNREMFCRRAGFVSQSYVSQFCCVCFVFFVLFGGINCYWKKSVCLFPSVLGLSILPDVLMSRRFVFFCFYNVFGMNMLWSSRAVFCRVSREIYFSPGKKDGLMCHSSKANCKSNRQPKSPHKRSADKQQRAPASAQAATRPSARQQTSNRQATKQPQHP